jgi:hypothetical protein
MALRWMIWNRLRQLHVTFAANFVNVIFLNWFNLSKRNVFARINIFMNFGRTRNLWSQVDGLRRIRFSLWIHIWFECPHENEALPNMSPYGRYEVAKLWTSVRWKQIDHIACIKVIRCGTLQCRIIRQERDALVNNWQCYTHSEERTALWIRTNASRWSLCDVRCVFRDQNAFNSAEENIIFGWSRGLYVI